MGNWISSETEPDVMIIITRNVTRFNEFIQDGLPNIINQVKSTSNVRIVILKEENEILTEIDESLSTIEHSLSSENLQKINKFVCWYPFIMYIQGSAIKSNESLIKSKNCSIYCCRTIEYDAEDIVEWLLDSQCLMTEIMNI